MFCRHKFSHFCPACLPMGPCALLPHLPQQLSRGAPWPPQRVRPPPPARLAAPARAGGGPRKSQQLTCVDCQNLFRRQQSDADWHAARGLTPAIRCKSCRDYRALARVRGDDADALFPLARSAEEYRRLRNAYLETHEAEAAAVAERRRALREAQVLLAGGRTAYRRAARKLSTLQARAALRAARRAAAAAAEGPPRGADGGAKKEAGEKAQAAPPKARGFKAATAMQRLGREE